MRLRIDPAPPVSYSSGDLVLFSGTGSISRAIQAATCSCFSHVGITCLVRRSQVDAAGQGVSERWAEQGWAARMLLVESTTLTTLPCEVLAARVRGVQAHAPGARLADYRGRAWRLPIAADWRLTEQEESALGLWLLLRLGKPYDRRQAVLSALRTTRWLPCLGIADASEEYCAELVVGALKLVRRLPVDVSPATFTPGGLVRRLLKAGLYGPPEPLQ